MMPDVDSTMAYHMSLFTNIEGLVYLHTVAHVVNYCFSHKITPMVQIRRDVGFHFVCMRVHCNTFIFPLHL
jgi:hypothetical protein